MANIVIADDSLFSRTMLKDILQKAGHTVIGEATNGQEAVDLFKQLQPDLIMLDVTMPLMDGLSASEQIISNNAKAKIIICSALRHDFIVEASYRIGVSAYLMKPFDPIRISQVVSEILAK